MPLADPRLRETLDHVFARQDLLEACQRRDLGGLIRILGTHGVTQGQMSGMVGIPQGRLSEYKTGKHQAIASSTFEKFADGLGMPPRLRGALGLAPGGADSSVTQADGTLPMDTFDLQLLAETIGRNGEDVKRRDLLSLAASLGAIAALAQSDVWERLAYALTNPAAMNEAIVRQMEVRSAGFHPAGTVRHGANAVQGPGRPPGRSQHASERNGLRPEGRAAPPADCRRRGKQRACGLDRK